MIFLSEVNNFLRVSVSGQETGCDHVVLQIKQGTTKIFEATSREIGSYYEFPGMDELIKAHMLQNNLSVFTVTAYYYPRDASGSQVDSYSKILTVIYAGAQLRKPGNLTADVFASLYFLTHYKSAWVATGDTYLLNYYAASDETYTIVRTYRDGTSTTATGTATAGTSTISVTHWTNCVNAVVTMGSRTFTIYYIDMDIVERFKFRNAFNAVESVVFPAATTEAPKTEFETAQQDNVLQRYDIEEQLEIKVKTPPLPAFMYQSMLDMCRSRYVEKMDQYTSGTTTYTSYSPVIIKEYKFDKSNEPNSPISLEMTLIYSDTERNSAIVV